MHIDLAIETAETLWKQSLESFFSGKYNKSHLVSHGIDHHRRVWRYGKELLLLKFKNVSLPEPLFVNKLIIACYLHDIGMAVDQGEKHGRASREFCMAFLLGNNLEIADYSDLLDAVENHDRKDYHDKHEKDSLLSLLSVADDLDAFGYIGILRYLEIYAIRGIELSETVNMVINNATDRFVNFERNFSEYPVFIEIHRKRFLVLTDFFEKYNLELKDL